MADWSLSIVNQGSCLRFLVHALNPQPSFLRSQRKHHGGGGVDAWGHVVGFLVKVAAGLDDEGAVVGAGHVDEGLAVVEDLAGGGIVAGELDA